MNLNHLYKPKIKTFFAPGGIFLMLISGAFYLISCQPNPAATEISVTATSAPPTLETDPPETPEPEIEDQPEDLVIPTPTVSPTQTINSVPVVSGEESKMVGQWYALDTTGGGGVTGVATHPTNPDIVYMSADNSGLFKTENGGDTWFSVSSNLGAYRLGSVALDPLNPDVIYVTAKTDQGHVTEGGATGEIHRSLNAGLTWEFVSDKMGFQSSFPSQASIIIPFDPLDANRFDSDGDLISDLILVGAWTGPADPPVGGIWRSEDEGESFSHLSLKDRNITALRSFPPEPNLLFVVTHEGDVYRSEDFGESWSNITGNMPLFHLSDLAVHPTDKNILYVTCRWCMTGEPPVWKTTDGGKNWQSASQGLDSAEIKGFPNILIDRFDADTLYVNTFVAPRESGSIYKSTDGGESWRPMPFRLVLPDGRPFHWFKFSRHLTLGQAIDGALFTSGSGVWRYPDGNLTDGEEVWEPATIGVGNVHVNSIKVDPLNPEVLYQGISDFGPYKSTDRGLSFHRILGNGWPVTLDNYVWNGPYYRNYRECSLACSTKCQATGKINSGGTTDFAISKQDPNIVYSTFGSGSNKSASGGVNKSTDGGATWQPVGFQLEAGFELNPETCLPYGFRHVEINPIDSDVVFVAQELPTDGSGALYKTTDGGLTWTTVLTTAVFIEKLVISEADPSLLVAATRVDVYRSDKGGEPGSWQDITPEGVRASIRAMALSPHLAQVMVVGTTNRGLYYSADGGKNWTQNKFEDLFEQKLHQGSEQYLEPELATAFNPNRQMRSNISAITFDPIVPDTIYAGGRQLSRTASIGVVKITNQGQNWERLPLEGLTHRNVFDLTLDPLGEFLYAGTNNGTYRFKLR